MSDKNRPLRPLAPLRLWDRALAPLEDGLAVVSGFCIFALMTFGVLQVLGRQLFNHPIAAYIDIVELAMGTFAFLGAAHCQRLGGHVRMDALVGRMPARTRWLVELAGTAIALIMIGVIVVFSFLHAYRALVIGDSTIDADLPLWPSKMVVPLALTVLWLRLFIQGIGFGRLVARPDAEPFGVPVVTSVPQQAKQTIEEISEVAGNGEPKP